MYLYLEVIKCFCLFCVQGLVVLPVNTASLTPDVLKGTMDVDKLSSTHGPKIHWYRPY